MSQDEVRAWIAVGSRREEDMNIVAPSLLLPFQVSAPEISLSRAGRNKGSIRASLGQPRHLPTHVDFNLDIVCIML